MAIIKEEAKNLKACFIGANMMGSGLAEAFIKSGAILEENIVFSDVSRDVLIKVRNKFPRASVTGDNTEAIQSSSVIFLCVKPDVPNFLKTSQIQTIEKHPNFFIY